jgi:pimeloyl-ACP methyl ester carboxylesterase
MNRSVVRRGWPLVAGLAVLGAVLAVSAQAPTGGASKAPTTPAVVDPNRQRVPITTADGVELDGTYFRSPGAGRDAPCVMLVHRFGTDRSKSDWINLALALQEANFAVLSFDLRGHGGSTQLSNPQTFWNLPFNRNGIRNGSPKKTSINSVDFKPSYFPFLVNDLAAARRFLEQKNDAGECNVHSLTIIGAQEGAGLGFLFTAAEYGRIYRIGVSALQSNGTPYNAGEDLAAGVWLSLTNRTGLASGPVNFDTAAWVRNHPGMREKTPMCFLYGDKDTKARQDAEAVFRVLTGPMTGRPDKHKQDDLHPIKGTDLAGPALLGQQQLMVTQYVVNFVKKVMADRRAIAWTEVKPEINTLQLVPVTQFGFRMP